MKTSEIPVAEAWRRRERHLATSVSEFASAVTSVHDATEALHNLVARTRSLLEVDMAYISLNGTEIEGFTSIVATDGVNTEAYRNLTVPMGIGVLGRVAQARGVVQTADYLTSEDFSRIEDVDRVVAGEGVKAILGAPMIVRSRIVGALMVANRFAYEFDDEEMFIAQTLANVAAVAVDNTRRFGMLRGEIERLNASVDDLTGQLDQQRHLLGIDEALLETLWRGGGLGDLEDGIGTVIGRTVRLFDFGVRHDTRDPDEPLLDLVRTLVDVSVKNRAPTEAVHRDGTKYTIAAAVRRDVTLGAVAVEGSHDDIGVAVVERCARILGNYLETQDAERADFVRRRGEAVGMLIDPPLGGVPQRVLHQLRGFGLREDRPFRVVVAQGSEASLVDWEHRLSVDFGAALLRSRVEGRLVVIAPEAAFTHIAQLLEAPGARRRGNLLVGHSPTLTGIGEVREEYGLVLRVLDAARLTGYSQPLVSLASYGAVGALLTRMTVEPSKRAVQDTLGPLLDYDRKNGTSLVETADTYLASGHSISSAAATLHVHENTVRQRLERVEKIMGEGWALGERGLDLQLMVAIHRLLGE